MMKNFLVSTFLLFVLFCSSCAGVSIPDGDWEQLEGDDEEVYGYTSLNISFEYPQMEKGKLSYGSITFSYEGGDWEQYAFSKPEISGNEAKCTATPYILEWNGTEEELKQNGNAEDCTITYDGKTKSVTVKVSDKFEIAFNESERCTFVAISEGNNITIRKSPVDGEKITTATTGEMMPLVAITSAPDNGGRWYEVKLPDSKKGFVNAKFVVPVTAKNYTVSDNFFEPGVSFSHSFENPGDDPRIVTVEFKRKGNEVMCYKNTMFPVSMQMAIEEYGYGKIEGNKIIIGKTLLGGDGYALFEDNNFAGLEEKAEPAEPEVWNTFWGNLYQDGIQYEYNYY